MPIEAPPAASSAAPMRGPYRAEMETILLEGRHPDGRPLGRALAHRLADAFGVPRPAYQEDTP